MSAKSRMLSLPLTAAILLSGCARAGGGQEARSSVLRDSDPGLADAVITSFVDANNAFAFELYQSVLDAPGNMAYSPFSLSIALGMTYAGARGDTESQMSAVLHFDLPQEQLHPAFDQLDLALSDTGRTAVTGEPPLKLQLTNGIWVDQRVTLLDQYLDLIAHNYGAGIHLADFVEAFEPARREINAWVRGQTEKRIEHLLPEGSLNSSTRMVLVNAIYFKGEWEDKFDANDTGDAPFYLLDGSQVAVPTMHAHLAAAPYLDGSGYQAVELPYQGGNAVMDIIVPDQGDFAAFESSIGQPQFAQIVREMQPASLQLGLPKFHFASAFDLGTKLSALGMPDAFNRDLADFSGMTGGRDLFIDKVLHQADISVDEEGTEAAAATAVIMGPTSALMPQAQLIIDRPFIFAIRDLSSGQILFLGRVLDPTAPSSQSQ